MGRGKKPALDGLGRKECSQCKEYKALLEFSPDKNHAFNVTSRCKKCLAINQSAKYDLKVYRSMHLKRTYGLTVEEYDQMYQEQKGVCACCGQPETTRTGRTKRTELIPALHVDHCHATGAVRGLLCSGCNTALGSLKEDPDRIKALLKYVEERVLW